MVKAELRVSRFKSIREARLELRRINVVIGPPESGKSNLLEAAASFTLLGPLENYRKSRLVKSSEKGGEVELKNLSTILRGLLRLDRVEDPFFMFSVDEPASISLNLDGTLEVEYSYEPGVLQISYGPIRGRRERMFTVKGLRGRLSVSASKYGLLMADELPKSLSRVKFYRFSNPKRSVSWGKELLPPAGENLVHLLSIRGSLREIVSSILSDVELKLSLERPTQRVRFVRQLKTGELLEVPWHLLSDTVRRMIFFLAAMETNENSFILLEEPEAHAFPYYTRFLAERLAMDRSNSYLITTHNPYFLETPVDKVPDEDIAVYLARSEGGVSEYTRVEASEIRDMIAEGADVFLELGAR